MRRWRGALALLLTALQAPAWAEPPVIRWQVHSLPPHFTYRDGQPPRSVDELGPGEFSGFLRQLVLRMPQYRHEFVEAGLQRFETDVRAGDGSLCTMLLLRTREREAWLHFTPLYPPMYSRQIHLIIRREDQARFAQFGPLVQLGALVKHRELTGLLPRDRSWGPRLDAALTDAGADAPPTVVTGKNVHLLAMLRAKRMDYTLEYPWLVKTSGVADLLMIPVAEGRDNSTASAGCGRNPEGRRRVEAIDAAIRQMARDPQREAWIQAWRGTVDRAEHRALLRYLDERARGGSQVE